MEQLMAAFSWANGILWSDWTPRILLAAGLLYTVWTIFSQYTSMTHGLAVVRGKYDNPDDPGAINHFQALSAALSATVGLGNIGGVALAIAAGGPGAVFYMWIVGLLGMALKTVEITLAMMYRNTDDPENPHGGAMWVVEKVLGEKGSEWKGLARAIGVFFCITLLISTMTGGNMFQAWSVAGLSEGYFGIPKVATGIIMALIVGAVIIGGIKRIGSVAGKLVPFMCLMYVTAAIIVLIVNIDEVPAMFLSIFQSAFNGEEAQRAFLGGSVGWAFIWGMKRALFSNEAGQGSAPIAHAAAKTDEPAREGIVGGIGPFIDTLCICTITALVILVTQAWNREAIGDIEGVVVVAQSAENPEVWQVRASTDFDALPESTQWGDDSNFYMVANVEGATHARGNSLVRLQGSVVVNDVDSGVRTLVWKDVKFDDKWDQVPSAVVPRDLGVYQAYDGAQLTAHAFDRQFPGLGRWLVTIAAWLFAISTMISWSYYGEQGMVYMLGMRSVLPYKLAFLACTIWAAAGINSTEHMEVFMDLGTGAMLWANLPIIFVFGHLAVRCLNDYGNRFKAGEFKRHD
ncbi:MAG: alanine/glycine:cation symporter family protein [Planctomycetota bacterium]